jgi:hypothetical protein
MIVPPFGAAHWIDGQEYVKGRRIDNWAMD